MDNKLINALDNNDNENILNFTTRKIMELNLKILKELMLNKETTILYLKKLKGYKYVDEINELKCGMFIRWIPIVDPNNITLTHCGIVCDIKITDDGIIIICKNFMHRHYTFKMDEVLIFQKLTSQEMVILSALDHLEAEEKMKKTTKANTRANTRANTNKKLEEDDDDESDESDEEDDDE
jgi:hypothetical protein